MRIEALLDDRDLIDDRRRRREPAEPQSRRHHLREAVQVDDEVLRVEIAQRRRRRFVEVQLAIGARPRRSARGSARPARSSSRRVRIGIVAPVGFWNVGLV